MADHPELSGPDLTLGVGLSELADGGKLLGHVGDEAVLLVRQGAEFFAVSAHCTHYNGPLAEGLLIGESIRCPWHHACFDLRTGEALRAPAFDPLSCWEVEYRDGRVIVRGKKDRPRPSKNVTLRNSVNKIVIVGGGAAGFAAIEMLRRKRYQGSIVMLSNDDAPPVDRPNLSKDYLAGKAPEEWVPLRPDTFYSEYDIDLRLKANVTGIDVRSREVVLADKSTISYNRLLLATGAEPINLAIPGATFLRSTHCARLPTVEPSLSKPRRRAGWSFSARALLDSRSRLPCAPESWKSM